MTLSRKRTGFFLRNDLRDRFRRFEEQLKKAKNEESPSPPPGAPNPPPAPGEDSQAADKKTSS
ncbi:MAG: hypothetical protein MUF51_02725 [Vicinamibacteria bacterium]|jgi:hypothetical protein|nr:hypothetical protein [Vicinamibacteria bacterium]